MSVRSFLSRLTPTPDDPTPDHSALYRVVSQLLMYPTPDLFDHLDVLEQVADTAGAAQDLAPLMTHLRERGLTDAQTYHVAEFDHSRRHALHLTFWLDGDTRRRGESLVRFKQVYRDSGLWVDLHGELPDFLPMVLEFAAHDLERGRQLLTDHRGALELMRFALMRDDLPHAGAVLAVCRTLPGDLPATREEAQKLVRRDVSGMNSGEPPTELVGLAPAGTETLPIEPTGRR